MHDTNLENWHKSTLFQLAPLGEYSLKVIRWLRRTYRSREASRLQWACLGPVESLSKAEQLAEKRSWYSNSQLNSPLPVPSHS